MPSCRHSMHVYMYMYDMWSKQRFFGIQVHADTPFTKLYQQMLLTLEPMLHLPLRRTPRERVRMQIYNKFGAVFK